MSDDLDKAIDRLTLAQKQALASVLSAAMSVDAAKRAGKPGEVAFTAPFTVGGRAENEEAVRDLLRRASPGGEGE